MNKHKEPLLFTIITLVGNLLPIVFSLFYFLANPNKWEGWKIFYNQGQFYLYTAGLLTSAAYIFYTFKVLNTDTNSILFFLSSGLILFSSVLYVMYLVGSNNNLNFLFYSSMPLFLVSIILYYVGNFTNNEKIDVLSAQKKQIDQILNQL